MGSKKFHAFDIVKYITLVIAAFMALIPIIVVFFISFKTSNEYANTTPLTPPKNWLHIQNYIDAFVDGGMLRGFFNTVSIMVVVLAGAIIIGTMVAYVLDRFKFKGSKLVVGAFLLATLIPSITTQVATYKVVNFFNLTNSRLAPMILGIGTDIISIYIFIQFISNISIALDESAMIEGASYLTIYRKIILPLLKPAIATVCILKGTAVYNDFYTPLLYMPKASLGTVSTSLYRFQGPYGGRWEVICAGVIIAIIPTMIIFLSLQKYFYNGFTNGSVKM
jgi:multiple sugar transport system permease protein